MTEKERVQYTKSFTFNAILKFGLEKELDELAKLANDGKVLDWKSPIIIASTYLEMLGLEILLQKDSNEELKRRSKTIKLPKKVENKFMWCTLGKANGLLLKYDLISQKQHEMIDSIREERNKIVHRLKSKEATVRYNPRLNPELNEIFATMVNNAKEIIKFLEESSKV